jgi:hypothetical protein
MTSMSERETGRLIPDDSQAAIELTLAVRAGDLEEVSRLLRDDPGLALARIAGRRGGSETALHLVAGWPGYFPRGPEIVALLAAAGADPDALTTSQGTEPGRGSETPLHYAASSDDADVAEALIDAGADLEVPGGSIGTPLDNAVGTAAGTSPGCWPTAAPGSTRPGTPQLSASSPGLRQSSAATRRHRTCRRRSGMPARPDSDAPPNTCWPAALT